MLGGNMTRGLTWGGVILAWCLTLGLGAVAITDAVELYFDGEVVLAAVAALFIPPIAVAGWWARAGRRDSLFLVFFSYFCFSAARTALFRVMEGRALPAALWAGIALAMLVAMSMFGLRMVRKLADRSPSRNT